MNYLPNLLMFCPRCERGKIIFKHKIQQKWYEGMCENCKENFIAKISK